MITRATCAGDRAPARSCNAFAAQGKPTLRKIVNTFHRAMQQKCCSAIKWPCRLAFRVNLQPRHVFEATRSIELAVDVLPFADGHTVGQQVQFLGELFAVEVRRADFGCVHAQFACQHARERNFELTVGEEEQPLAFKDGTNVRQGCRGALRRCREDRFDM